MKNARKNDGDNPTFSRLKHQSMLPHWSSAFFHLKEREGIPREDKGMHKGCAYA